MTITVEDEEPQGLDWARSSDLLGDLLYALGADEACMESQASIRTKKTTVPGRPADASSADASSKTASKKAMIPAVMASPFAGSLNM
ncbi:hypothetical protein E4U59_001572 [Claviceps monticola]|nr:hypothetical protein E4U59_001572 [Claviceps monticola]